jgi:hypothetical protein
VNVSGTLVPATLSVNGRPVSVTSRQARGLLVNGTPVETHGSDIGAFFQASEANLIDLKWDWPDSTPENIAVLRYPSIVSFTVSPDHAEIQVDEQTRALSIDGSEIPLENQKARIPISMDGPWLTSEHALDLRAQDGGSRVYSASLGALRDSVLSDWRLGAGLLSPASGGNMGYTLWFGHAWPSRVSLNTSFTVSFYTQGVPTPGGGTYSRNDYELRTRLGYDPFRSGTSIVDFRRLTLGIALTGLNSYASSSGPFQNNMSNDKLFVELGFAIRIEPFRWQDFGWATYFEPQPFRFLRPFDYAGISAGWELCKHW